ncbi:MAG: 1-acyl-sn-glycerol-3-phosphate acyltransferase [Gammaproteobacteria bacterium]|jgi:1-acyl-sn-glycerol-3-phosphate acyltransferase|nr:1-acyl-sn-glycerol-3-phosphate acyltransferase [Gammaproteobacteria bacterium]
MIGILRWLFFTLLVRPVVGIVLGMNVRGREHLPKTGPAIITANHNSHLDAMVLMSLLPHRLLHRVRPVAAADYFMKGRFLSWFSTKIIGILPIARKSGAGDDPLAGCYEALEAGEILIIFPEGSRGEPERMAPFRGGVAKLARLYPDVPVAPVFMHGLGKALPRGEGLLVPFMLDIYVGPSLHGRDEDDDFLVTLREKIEVLASQHHAASWD